MAYNHGREDRKWRIWKEAEEKLLRECGVDEATIEQIRIADRADFNSKLAEKANISRSLLSVIEAPNAAHSFSLEVLYDIADALDVTPADLINASLFSDNIINNKHD